MPIYIVLMKYTDQGIKNVEKSSKQIEDAWKSMEGKVAYFYSVLGEYDCVLIGEAPSDEIAGAFALKLCSLGNIRTTTLPAFTIQSSLKDDPSMPTYILLMRYTDMGVRRVKDSSKRIEEGIKGWDTLGGKLISFYSVMGGYDLVAIGDAPSGEIVAHFCLKLSSLGNVRTTTLRVFTMEEFAEMIKKVP